MGMLAPLPLALALALFKHSPPLLLLVSFGLAIVRMCMLLLLGRRIVMLRRRGRGRRHDGRSAPLLPVPVRRARALSRRGVRIRTRRRRGMRLASLALRRRRGRRGVIVSRMRGMLVVHRLRRGRGRRRLVVMVRVVRGRGRAVVVPRRRRGRVLMMVMRRGRGRCVRVRVVGARRRTGAPTASVLCVVLRRRGRVQRDGRGPRSGRGGGERGDERLEIRDLAPELVVLRARNELFERLDDVPLALVAVPTTQTGSTRMVPVALDLAPLALCWPCQRGKRRRRANAPVQLNAWRLRFFLGWSPFAPFCSPFAFTLPPC
ncbi:hypothetical protein EXIGLDRAFT_114084 [Exidia glandulosa HHB12029]|uniref:Uncharacterized protein n=1 Tax=Exidia glandulosa HHB12029 TaxID=1314781 RepID=A0A165GMG4_EXIGL|nr:hypothetical protein EXIGLDRAFT_114084 [Exidia glandulosa HHB12029]